MNRRYSCRKLDAPYTLELFSGLDTRCFRMEVSQLDWGDLRYVLTLAECRSLQHAAERLEVNRTTVSRRIEHLERALGTKLFVKQGRDLAMTETGKIVRDAAKRVETEVVGLQRSVREHGDQLEGTVRITATPKMCALLEPALSVFLKQYPEMSLEVSASMQREDIDTLESDLALRLTYSPQEDLIGRCLAKPASALYASAEFAESMPGSGEVNFIEAVTPLDVQPWLTETLGLIPKVILRSNSTELSVHYVRSGIGAAYLPCYVGELESDLVRVSPIRKGQMPELWLLYPPQHRDVKRIKMVADVVEQAVLELKPMIEGRL